MTDEGGTVKPNRKLIVNPNPLRVTKYARCATAGDAGRRVLAFADELGIYASEADPSPSEVRPPHLGWASTLGPSR